MHIAVTSTRQHRMIFSLKHTCPIDWLELSPSGRRLLFRDAFGHVSVCDIQRDTARGLYAGNTAQYVQWAPNGDVVLYQDAPGTDVLVWYSPVSLSLS
ncbi:hypothetical protein KIPB_015266, partial [Kipferlia bialata]|eukprot:g15266.t1